VTRNRFPLVSKLDYFDRLNWSHRGRAYEPLFTQCLRTREIFLVQFPLASLAVGVVASRTWSQVAGSLDPARAGKWSQETNESGTTTIWQVLLERHAKHACFGAGRNAYRSFACE